jgi:hypothetical protein
MSVEGKKSGLLCLEISAIKLEKVPESALCVEKVFHTRALAVNEKVVKPGKDSIITLFLNEEDGKHSLAGR